MMNQLRNSWDYSVRALCLVACMAFPLAAPAGGFYLRYDADVYPEQAGWTRYGQDPDEALVRELHDGVLRLDTRGSPWTFDLYEFYSDELEPGLGEQLRIDWRVRTLEARAFRGSSEVSMFVANRDDQYVQFAIGTDHVAESLYVFGDDEYLAPIDPATPHTYSMLTPDMHTYDFLIDGAFAFSGEFHFVGLRDGPVVSFGDGAHGFPLSLAEWDYVAIAVVPEPSTIVLLGAYLATRLTTHRRRSNVHSKNFGRCRHSSLHGHSPDCRLYTATGRGYK